MSTERTSISESDLPELLTDCERRLGYVFRDKSLLQAALTHASGADHRLLSNERLEFLGDALLGAIVCEHLFRRYPDYLEGDLTKIKSIAVSRQTCARISQSLGLTDFLILGKGMTTSRCIPQSVLADVFESLVAAIYLDGGSHACREFVLTHMTPEIEAAVRGALGINHKSLLQQVAQRDFGATPIYELLDEKGPDHSKCFKIAAKVAGRYYAAAWGRNKKEAEQLAAQNALNQMAGRPAPHAAD